MMWYSQKVQAGLNLICSVFCVWMVEDVLSDVWGGFDAALVSEKGQKVSNVTIYHIIYQV